MRRKIASVLAWIVATVASILLATAAVGDVGNRVSDRPAPLQSAAGSLVTLSPASSTTRVDPAPSTSAAGPSTTRGTTTSSTTTAAPAASTTTTAQTTRPPTTTRAPVTSTTSTSTTSTTTPPPDDEYFESRQLIGGWVQLRITGDKVYLEAAVPEPGFSVDVEHNGPETVEVEFTSEAHDSILHAEVEDGELDIDIDEESDD